MSILPGKTSDFLNIAAADYLDQELGLATAEKAQLDSDD